MVVRDAHDAITVQDLEGRILAWNPGAERMYGWSEAEALAMNIRDLIPEGRREEALAMVRQLARAEVLEPYRTQRIAKDGRIVEVWLTATALMNESGEGMPSPPRRGRYKRSHDSGREPVQIRLSTLRRIRQAHPKRTQGRLCASGRRRWPGKELPRCRKTWRRCRPRKRGARSTNCSVHQIELEMQNEELRRTQEELEASRARYFDLYDLAPVGYFTLSEQGLILEANLTAAKLLGVARGALVKQPLSRFILPEDQDIYYRHRKQLFETGAPQAWELRLVRKDAAPFWARVEATTAQDADGAAVCRAVVSDITERKRAERGAQDHQRRTSEFAYALTHDLQEPLRMVVNFTQLLAQEHEGKLGEDADKYIAYSVEGALRIEALLKALLNYWEITERDGDPLSPVDCNHVAIADAAVPASGHSTERRYGDL